MKSLILLLSTVVCLHQSVLASGQCDTLPTPTGLTVDILAPDDAKLSWDDVPGAKGYMIQFRKVGSWTTSKTVPEAKKRAYPVDPGATYQFRVRGVCLDSSTTAYSAWTAFTMPDAPTGPLCDGLSPPTNLAADITAPDDALLSWDPLAGVSGYEITLHKIGEWTGSQLLVNNERRAYPLEPGAGYRFRVKGICSDSSITGNSYWFSFVMPTDTVTPPVWTCGDDLIDDRDGQVYGTVQIGTQCWMSDNFNYDPGTDASGYRPAQNPANSQLYGGYYDWTVAKQIDSFWLGDFYAPEGEQGVCPDGWHVPTDPDWVTLLNYPGIDGNSLAIGGSSGFDLPMSGYISTSGGYQVEGLGTILISSSENSKQRMWAYIVTVGNPLIERGGIVKPCRGPLRCILD